MPTTPSSLYPSYYDPQYTGGTVSYQTGNNPVKTTQNQRAVVQSTGDQLMSQDEALANEYAAQQGGTQSYLNPLEMSNASGQGGYTADQASQIELTPEQRQNIVTGAGISAGAGTASSVGAAERAAAAAGGGPAALATYRARAAQTQAADAGQAETGASVAAQQAGSAGAQAVGNTQIAQENQGQNYFANLQAAQGNQAETEQGLAHGAYGTQTSGTGAATNSELSAAGIPTSTDKIIGAVAGAAGAAGLADGYPGYMDDGGQDAVVGEDGMEAVIENAPKAVVEGASDPVRSNTKFMANGDYGGETNSPVDPSTIGTPASPAAPSNGVPGWLRSYLANAAKQSPGTQAPAPGQPGWNKTTPYSQLGASIGGVAKPFIQKAMAPSSSAAPTGNSTNGGVDPSLISGGGPDYVSGGDPGVMMADGDSGNDGRPMLANGKVSNFHWPQHATPAPQTPHMQERAGYQPLGYRAKPMLADGAVKQQTQSAPKQQLMRTLVRTDQPHEQLVRTLVRTDLPPLPNPLSTLGKPDLPPAYQGQDNHETWPDPEQQIPHMADGAMPEEGNGQPVEPGNGMQVGNAKVFNRPTLVHLEKADMVVPLGYRAKAKVRPSAALPAMKAAAPRRMYGHAA